MTVKTTQAEVARVAGVTQSTVSQVLSNRSTRSIAPETSELILQIADQLGYKVRNTEKVPHQKTGNIGVLLMRDRDIPDVQDNFRRFNMGIIETLQENNYHLLLDLYTPGDPLPAIIRNHKVDGIIIEDRFDQQTLSLLSERLPVAMINFSEDSLSIDSFMPDNIGGIDLAVSHLIELGHRRIAIFGSEPNTLHHTERLAGYHAAMATRRLPICEDYLAILEPQYLHDTREMEDYAISTLKYWKSLEEPPTALITLSDNYVPMLYHAARTLNISIPEDLSIIGFDNLPICNNLKPTLTSIEQPMEEMGRLASRYLLERIDRKTNRPATRIRVNATLIVRDSTIRITHKDNSR